MKKLLQEVLDALHSAGHGRTGKYYIDTAADKLDDIANKLRAAIDAPEEQPVAWFVPSRAGWFVDVEKYPCMGIHERVPIYTKPQTGLEGYRQGVEDRKEGKEPGPVADLTNEEILNVFATCHIGRLYPQDFICGPKAMRLTEARAVLAAQKAKQ